MKKKNNSFTSSIEEITITRILDMFAVLLNGDELLLGWILVGYSPPQRLWAKKNWGKAGEKNEKKYEKRRKPLPDTTPKTRAIRGSIFQISTCMLMIITIKIISFPVLNLSGHSRPSLANIPKLMQNAEPCLRHHQGYDVSKVCAKYQGTFALSVRQKAKTISMLSVTCLSLTGQWSVLKLVKITENT